MLLLSGFMLDDSSLVNGLEFAKFVNIFLVFLSKFSAMCRGVNIVYKKVCRYTYPCSF